MKAIPSFEQALLRELLMRKESNREDELHLVACGHL